MAYPPWELEMVPKTPESLFVQAEMVVLPLLAKHKSYFGYHAIHGQGLATPSTKRPSIFFSSHVMGLGSRCPSHCPKLDLSFQYVKR
jgi:hypothetical protein